MASYPDVLIIYKASKTSKKYQLKIFENTHVDTILETIKRKPLIPKEWQLEVISVGTSDANVLALKKKYNIKK
jgi:hypothetical protein